MNTSIPPQSRSQRFFNWAERAALFVILSAVALLAGKVAFGRVVDWTMANSPDATPRYAGWTNGVISELLPIGVLLFIRHQKRHGRTPGVLAWSALVGAVLFSLAAQLAQAVPNIGGWIVAALPSAAFAVLSKLVVSMRTALESGEPSASEDGETLAASGPVAGPAVATAAGRGGSLPPGAAPRPEAGVPSKAEPRKPHRVRARSLTSAAKVEKAAKELGGGATPAQVAARASVSESTARRYMPKAV